jgi:hypothetical protein
MCGPLGSNLPWTSHRTTPAFRNQHIPYSVLLRLKPACQIFERGIVVGADTGRSSLQMTIANRAVLTFSGDHTRLCWMNTALVAIDEKMPAQPLNQMGELSLRWKSRSLLPSLNTIIEVDEDAGGDSPKTTMLFPSNQQLGPTHTSKRRRYMWFCCQCGDGPSDVDYVTSCTDCFHPRCNGCEVATKRA